MKATRFEAVLVDTAVSTEQAGVSLFRFSFGGGARFLSQTENRLFCFSSVPPNKVGIMPQVKTDSL
jgi:hypothetical protein